MLIQNTRRDNNCDIEQDYSKYAEDETYDRGLILMNLDTKETTMLSSGRCSASLFLWYPNSLILSLYRMFHPLHTYYNLVQYRNCYLDGYFELAYIYHLVIWKRMLSYFYMQSVLMAIRTLCM